MDGKELHVAILALQGNFIQHAQLLQRCAKAINVHVHTTLIKHKKDLKNANDLHGLIIGGGESTTLRTLLHTEALFNPIQALLEDHEFPLLTTCAGTILLARKIVHEIPAYPNFIRENFDINRNAFGRQTESFYARLPFTPHTSASSLHKKNKENSPPSKTSTKTSTSAQSTNENGAKNIVQDSKTHSLFPKTIEGFFIRAPKFAHISQQYKILTHYRTEPVLIQRSRSLFCTFHPEVANDPTVHLLFLLQILQGVS